jgi:hypothetical protein
VILLNDEELFARIVREMQIDAEMHRKIKDIIDIEMEKKDGN